MNDFELANVRPVNLVYQAVQNPGGVISRQRCRQCPMARQGKYVVKGNVQDIGNDIA
jgi:hypothetical protein